MRTILENLREDQSDPRLQQVRCGGRYVVNDIGQAIAEIELLKAALQVEITRASLLTTGE